MVAAVREFDLRLPDGRNLHCYDRPPGVGAVTVTIHWHHGSPNIGVRFAVMGHSGGGPHALAAAALLPHRVSAAVAMSGPAPYDAGFDFFAGMGDSGALRAATLGRDARVDYETTAEAQPPPFTSADWAALDGDWAWLLEVVRPALAGGPEALIDDDVAIVRDWGFRPSSVEQPVLLLHGRDDEMVPASHAQRLRGRSVPS